MCVTLFSLHGGAGFWSFKIQLNLVVGALINFKLSWCIAGGWIIYTRTNLIPLFIVIWSQGSNVPMFQSFLVYWFISAIPHQTYTSVILDELQNMILHHIIHLCRLKMDPSLVYVPSLIFQITYSCLNELNEQMEVFCRLCEYQVILLLFLVTGICCSMKLDIWKWLILDLGNFWMPRLHKRICIQWRGRLDHVRRTFFFTLVHGSEFAVMVCYTWVLLYCCKWHDQWGFSYYCMKILEVDIFCKSSFPLFLIDQDLRVFVGFHLFNILTS